jgi:hypothetical protein
MQHFQGLLICPLVSCAREVGMQHFQGLLICPLVFCVGEVGVQHFEGPLMSSKCQQATH